MTSPIKEEWRHDSEGDLDDIVVPNVSTFHMERLDVNRWWIGIYRADGTMVHIDLTTEGSGVIATRRED